MLYTRESDWGSNKRTRGTLLVGLKKEDMGLRKEDLGLRQEDQGL